MSLLAVGLSHNTSTVPLLEQVSIAATDVPKVLHELIRADHVAEAFVVSTCNRVEVYAEVEKFHGGLFEITAVLARHAGMEIPTLGEHLYVHYEQAAVHHLFRVAAGLDSMVVGESQILGQLRAAYAVAGAEHTVGRTLHELAQRALSAGKRAHAETGIDRAGASVVGAALQHATDRLGTLAGRRALVIGAGSMGALAGTTLRRAGVEDLVVANRTAANAGRLADSLGARATGLDALEDELDGADLVVSSTGSTSLVVTADLLEQVMTGRPERPLTVLDLAMPRDVDATAGQLPGVTYVDLETLREATADTASGQAVEQAEELVAEDVAAYLAWQRATEVAPTVVALRARASEVVDAELAKLDAKLPGLDPRVRGELQRTIRRTVSTLLHAPTVRMKQLAEAPGGDVYASALRTLFELSPGEVSAVSTVEPAGIDRNLESE